MTRSLLRWHKETDYASVVWRKSSAAPGASFAVRKPSLAQRIELAGRARELALKHEFLQAGGQTEQIEATLSELLVKKLYLEWGFAGMKGFRIDGKDVTAEMLIERGPEALSEEIVSAVLAESAPSDTQAEEWRAGIDIERLGHWMADQGLGAGPIEDPVLLGGGTQNLLLHFRRGERDFVLRRPPLNLRANSNER